MSFDLGVFYTQRPHSDNDAGERYVAYCEEDDLSPWIEPNPNVANFLKELTDQYPDIDDAPADKIDDCPWAAGLDVSEGHVLMPMVFSAADRMYPIIINLARKHGLVCFDPQDSRIVTAPPGVHVNETESPPVVIPDNPKNPARPLADTLKKALTPLGFVRKGRYWRKDADNAVIALEAGTDDGIYGIGFFVWFKALGEIEPAEVKSGGEYHIYEGLVSDLTPNRLKFRLLRAFHFGSDYADSISRLYGTDEAAREISSYYEPREPLTPAWRAATLQEALDEHLLPLIERIESGDHEAILAERKAEQEQEELDIHQAAMRELRVFVALCRQWQKEGLEESELIARTWKEAGTTAFAALTLGIARNWTIAETRDRMEAGGIRWSGLTDELIDDEIKDQECLVKQPDGRIELLPEQS